MPRILKETQPGIYIMNRFSLIKYLSLLVTIIASSFCFSQPGIYFPVNAENWVTQNGGDYFLNPQNVVFNINGSNTTLSQALFSTGNLTLNFSPPQQEGLYYDWEDIIPALTNKGNSIYNSIGPDRDTSSSPFSQEIKNNNIQSLTSLSELFGPNHINIRHGLFGNPLQSNPHAFNNYQLNLYFSQPIQVGDGSIPHLDLAFVGFGPLKNSLNEDDMNKPCVILLQGITSPSDAPIATYVVDASNNPVSVTLNWTFQERFSENNPAFNGAYSSYSFNDKAVGICGVDLAGHMHTNNNRSISNSFQNQTLYGISLVGNNQITRFSSITGILAADPAPEPGSFVALSMGGIMLMQRFRRRKKVNILKDK